VRTFHDLRSYTALHQLLNQKRRLSCIKHWSQSLSNCSSWPLHDFLFDAVCVYMMRKHTTVGLAAMIVVILIFTIPVIAPLSLLLPIVTVINIFSVVVFIASWWSVQGRTQGQLDKAEGEPNHWTFLTGNTVATLPMTRLIALAAPLSVHTAAFRLSHAVIHAVLGRLVQSLVLLQIIPSSASAACAIWQCMVWPHASHHFVATAVAKNVSAMHC